MLRLEDSHGVIQKRGRGPVNEFGQDSEKRKSCLVCVFVFVLFFNRKKTKSKPFLLQKQVLSCQKTGLSNEPDPVVDQWEEVCTGWDFSA